ncbi:MAG: DUF975 family protein [Eubacterium sp.]|nr:DUF975 family protein [Eubacterium sp.]
MWNRKELKEKGKLAFKVNYWRCVLSAFLLSFLISAGTVASRTNSSGTPANNPEASDAVRTLQEFAQQNPATFGAIAGIVAAVGLTFIIIGIVLKIFLFNPLEVGCYRFFKENIRTDGQAGLDNLKAGFGQYGHTFATLFLRDLFLILWSFLFIIPAIVKSYSYRMVPFIIKDRPELSATEAITESRRMMDGHKWNTFVLDLSFLGWMILGIITLGIVNIFWTEPYRQNTNAALYLKLSGQDAEAGSNF